MQLYDQAQTTDHYQEGSAMTMHSYNYNDSTAATLTGNNNSRPSMMLQTGVISKSTLGVALLVNTVIIIFFISLAGSILNLLNIIVFVKQGLKDPMTITLFVLSVSDFGSVFTLWLQSMFMTLHFFPETFKEIDPRYLTGFMSWPHSVFVRVACLLTVFIAFERWVCVSFPLKANQIITTGVAKIYNIVVFCCLAATFLSLYSYSSMRRMFIPWENRTLYIITLSKSGLLYAKQMSSIVTSVYLSTFCLLVIFTALTIIKLNLQAKWRKSMSTSAGQVDTATQKSQKAVKMVVVICLTYIGTSLPSVGNTLAMIFLDGYIDFGRYHNLYTLVGQVCFVFEVANSTANFFIYFRMSSNFSATLNTLLGKQRDTKTNGRGK